VYKRQIFGDPTWVAGVRDTALQFDGADDRVLIPDDQSLDVQNGITISAWLRPEEEGTQYVISKATKNEENGFELSLSSQGTIFVRFNESSSGNDFRLDSNTDYPTDGATWIHVTATYDGDSIRMYINGQLETTRQANFQIAINDLELSLGGQHDGYRSFNGALDGVRLFDRALDDSEVLALYQS
jgi:hypothetical protein